MNFCRAFFFEMTIKTVGKRGVKVIPATGGSEAPETATKIIFSHAEGMTASSTTLIEIRLGDYVAEGTSGGNLLRAKITAENDPVKRALSCGGIHCRRVFYFRHERSPDWRDSCLECKRESCRTLSLSWVSTKSYRRLRTHLPGSGCMSTLSKISGHRRRTVPPYDRQMRDTCPRERWRTHHPCSGQ